jgi:RNA polymerase sigma-70 factor (ECF subfamily)
MSSAYLRLVTAAPRAGETPVAAAFRENASLAQRVALRILRSESDVDDVLQDVFLAAQRDLRDTSEPKAVRRWFVVATVRLCRRRARRQQLFRFFTNDEPGYDAIASRDASPEARAQVAALFAVLDGLPLQGRIAWTLRHLEGMPLAEVADACGCSLATAKRRIAAAHELITEAWNG